MRLLLLISALAFAAAGCPEAKEKHEEVTDKVGHAAKTKLDQVEQRANAAAKKASARLDQAAANADEATNPKDEGGW